MCDAVLKYCNRLIYFLYCVIFVTAFYGSPVWALDRMGRSEYQRVLDEVNSSLSEVREARACPGIGLAYSCGDKFFQLFGLYPENPCTYINKEVINSEKKK